MTAQPHNPKYDGLKVFLPRVDRFLSGDLILTRNQESGRTADVKMSGLVQRATGGTFSHVLICTTPPTMIEAMPDGVMNLSLQRCFTHGLENVRVLRYPDADIAAKAANRANIHIGRDYSKRKAAASVFPTQVIGAIRDNGTFCSALAAQVYVEAGALEFKTAPVEKTTPATIEHMGGLKDVTTELFREALAPRNIEIMTALDGDRLASPAMRQTALYLSYLPEVLPFADELLEKFSGAGFSAPGTFFEVIRLIMQAWEVEPRIAPGDRDAYRTLVANLDNAAAACLNRGELDRVASELNALDVQSITRDLAESIKAKPDIDLESIRGLIGPTEKQLAARREALASFQDWKVARSPTVDAWIRVQASVIPTFEHRLQAFREIVGRLGGS